MRISDWSSDVCSSDRVFGRVMIDRMAARLRGQHQRKARIARDVDLVERVHLDSDAKRHWGLLLCVGRVGARRREVTRSRRSRYAAGACRRSEEHTSELQSPMRISYAVFCLKKKEKN